MDSRIAALKQDMTILCQLLEDYSHIEETLTQSVKGRDWPNIEARMDRLNSTAKEIDEVESRRHDHFRSLAENASFSEWLGEQPVTVQAELGPLHRRIRLALVRIRGLSKSLFYTFRGIQESLQQILAEIFPHRRGKIYSRAGNAQGEIDEAMVVNQER